MDRPGANFRTGLRPLVTGDEPLGGPRSAPSITEPTKSRRWGACPHRRRPRDQARPRRIEPVSAQSNQSRVAPSGNSGDWKLALRDRATNRPLRPATSGLSASLRRRTCRKVTEITPLSTEKAAGLKFRECVADDAVRGEPVSARNSLVTGNLQGSFAEIRLLVEILALEAP